MTELWKEQVRNALNAVVRRDVELAQKVMATDDQVDHYRDQIFPRTAHLYDGRFERWSFPAFEVDSGGEKSGADWRPRYEYRGRRDLHRAGAGYPASVGGPAVKRQLAKSVKVRLLRRARDSGQRQAKSKTTVSKILNSEIRRPKVRSGVRAKAHVDCANSCSDGMTI